MTSAFDGRVTAAIRKGAPLKFVWEGAWLTYSYAAILKGGPDTANAQKLFALEPGADCGRIYSRYWLSRAEYTPAPVSPSGVDPAAQHRPKNAKVIPEDSAWLAARRPDGKTNADHLQERWLAWRAQ
ncbi:hypothetical protein [Bradyrhizobium glycinis]|uniref:hypothetical protein n=1 Tax=Bradyrhizobium glycinis TaxID=2751812 RepID=UPI0018D91CFA|nr:hypothetical protein [Bradyrhizobium glycinis]MBH5371589.1 hypothetical protein [Bradyrhizobium glycinis]